MTTHIHTNQINNKKKNIKRLNATLTNRIKILFVLDKTLNDIQVVYDLITKRLLYTFSPRTKYFTHFFVVQ